LLIDPFAADFLFGAHLIDELIDATGEFTDFGAMWRLLRQRLGWHDRLFAEAAGKILKRPLHVDDGAEKLPVDVFARRRCDARRRPLGDPGQPFFKLVLKAIARVARLQFEKT
jgi:hypothetical protein